MSMLLVLMSVFLQVVNLERVCYACWVAATREVARQRVQDCNRNTEAQPEDSVAPIPPPLPEPTAEVPILQRNPSVRVLSAIYKRVGTRRTCLFPTCPNQERLLVPSTIKEMVLLHFKLYIPLHARICRFHIINNEWDTLENTSSEFTGFEMDNMLSIMEKAATRKIDFTNIRSLDPNLCHYWLGMDADQFEELLAFIPSLNEEVPSASVALSIFLIKLRTGDSNERLSTIFKMSRRNLERYMAKARNSLLQHFVPLFLGTNCTTVQHVASKNKIIPDGLFGNPQMPPDTKPAITICDGTYIYVQSSSNYTYQKRTFSLHKHTNLVKPFLIVCCDGYILDCLGPYKATTNDATIMAQIFEDAEGPMRTFFRQDDVFILDRGFRDVIPVLQSYGFKAYMPESLISGEHQLTTLQANRSRCVTMCRWVVEVINGRIKRDFKLFRQEYFNLASAHLMTDFKIACALLNKFHPVIGDRPEALEILNKALSCLNTTNYLSEYVQNENLNRRRAMFQAINATSPHLNDFPKLNMRDLRMFALGSYQIKQAVSYYGEHIRSSGQYQVEVADEIFEDDIPLIFGQNNMLLRGRIRSRYVTSRTYYCYILISKNQNVLNTLNAIIGYYCTCLIGKRTVGCCAHIMAIVWYLSWGRYNDVSAPASFLDDIFIDD